MTPGASESSFQQDPDRLQPSDVITISSRTDADHRRLVKTFLSKFEQRLQQIQTRKQELEGRPNQDEELEELSKEEKTVRESIESFKRQLQEVGTRISRSRSSPSSRSDEKVLTQDQPEQKSRRSEVIPKAVVQLKKTEDSGVGEMEDQNLSGELGDSVPEIEDNLKSDSNDSGVGSSGSSGWTSGAELAGKRETYIQGACKEEDCPKPVLLQDVFTAWIKGKKFRRPTDKFWEYTVWDSNENHHRWPEIKKNLKASGCPDTLATALVQNSSHKFLSFLKEAVESRNAQQFCVQLLHQTSDGSRVYLFRPSNSNQGTGTTLPISGAALVIRNKTPE